MKEIHELHDEKRNCTLERRAKFWAKLGGKEFELTPDNFHVALAQWLHNAGIIEKDRVKDASAALYCLGVTNSNNLFRKSNKVDSMIWALVRTVVPTVTESTRNQYLFRLIFGDLTRTR